jgi:acetyl-CoA synthetase
MTAGYLVGVASTHHYTPTSSPTPSTGARLDVGWVTGHSYIVYGRSRTDDRRHVRRRRTIRIRNAGGRSWSATRSTPLHGADGDRSHMKWGPEHAQSTTSRHCACSAASASRSIRAWIWYREHIGGDGLRS